MKLYSVKNWTVLQTALTYCNTPENYANNLFGAAVIADCRTLCITSFPSSPWPYAAKSSFSNLHAMMN